MKFVKEVRTGSVRQPTQKSFDLRAWNDAFSAIEQPAAEDIRLYESGRWAFLKFESIRRKLNPIWVRGHSKRVLLSMFVGAANRDCHLLAKLTSSVDSDEVLFMEQIIQAKVEQPYGFGPASPEAMLLSSIDSLRFPIRMVHSHKDAIDCDTETTPELQILGRVRASAYLGQMYSMIEGYWMHALWNGWYVDSTTRDDSDLILPPNKLNPIVTAISDYRRQALITELILGFCREWKYVLAESQRRLLTSSLPQINIIGDQSERTFRVASRMEGDEEVMISLVKGLQAERGYYAPLMDEPLENVGGVSLRMLLRAWQVLYALCEVLMSIFPSVEDSGVYSIEKLLRYAPAVSKKDITDLIVEWCKVEEAVAQTIVKFFSYGPRQEGELWGHPLVEINDSEVLPLIAPIRYSNIERTFELWMKDSGFRLTDKGPLFENYIRRELNDSLNRSELLKDAAVYPGKLVLREGNVSEEIDLVIRLKNTVLIGEAKCLLFPSEPIEIARYFEVLENAATQVLRKANFARRNLSRLADQLGIGSRQDNLNIEPFILVNQPFGAGFPQSEVPVADELIFKRFFEGKWYGFGIYEKGNLQSHSRFNLYESEDEAASTISAYLRNPPQLRRYRQTVRPELQWYPAIDKEDRQFATVNLDVVLPLPSLDLRFEKNV